MRKVHEEVSTASSRPLWPALGGFSQINPLVLKIILSLSLKRVLAIVNVRDGIGMEGSLTN